MSSTGDDPNMSMMCVDASQEQSIAPPGLGAPTTDAPTGGPAPGPAPGPGPAPNNGGVENLLNRAGITPVALGRLGGVDLPTVGDPPVLSPQQLQEIKKRTGISPDEHHDRVRQAVMAIERDLARFQIRAVQKVEQTAVQARRALEMQAGRIPGVVSGAVALVRNSATTARNAVNTRARTALGVIDAAAQCSTEEVDGHKETTVENVLDSMDDNTGELRQLYNTQLKPAYQTMARDYGGKIMAYVGGAGGNACMPQGEPMNPTAQGKAQQVADAYNAETDGVKLQLYQHEQRAYELPDLGTQLAADLAAGGTSRSADLLSTQMEGQFTLFFLQLVDPTAVYIRQEAEADNMCTATAGRVVEFRLASGRERAHRAVELLQEQAIAQINQVETQVIQSIREAGQKVQQSVMAQAKTVERGLLGAAEPFAAAYAKEAHRVAGMLKPGTFYDNRTYLPALKKEHQSVFMLEQGQRGMVEKQRKDAEDAARHSTNEQIHGLWEAGRGGVRAIDQIKNPTLADIETVETELVDRSSATATTHGAAAERQTRAIGRRFGRTPAAAQEAAMGILNSNIKANFDGILSSFKTETDRRRDSLDERVAGPNRVYAPIDDVVNNQVIDRRNAVRNAVEHQTLGFLGGTDEDALFRALTGLSDKGLDAVAQSYQDEWHQDMRARIRSELEAADQYRAANKLLDTASEHRRRGQLESTIAGARNFQRAVYAAALSEDSTRWFGVAHDVREGALRALSPEERAQLTNVPGWSGTLTKLRSDLTGTNLQVTEALVAGNPERAFALRMNERMNQALNSGNNDQSVDALQQISQQIEADLQQVHRRARIPPSMIRSFEDKMFREHAVVAGQRTQDQLAALDVSTARQLFVQHHSRSIEVYVPDGEGHGHTETRRMSAEARTYLEARVIPPAQRNPADPAHDENAPGARAALLAYERSRARQEGGGMSEYRRERVTKAGEDVEYFQAERALREAQAWQGPADQKQARIAAAEQALVDVRRRHNEFLMRSAELMGASDAVRRDPSRAREFVAGEMESLFAPDGGWGRQAGRSIIENGRVDLLAATMLATEGGGTHEQYLKSAYAGRSREEIADLRQRYATKVAGNSNDLGALDRMLGTNGNTGWGTETSGDDAQELTLLLAGEARTDRDRARVAMIRVGNALEQGDAGRSAMNGTPEANALSRHQAELEDMILQAVRAHGGTGPAFINGEPNPAAFDREGNFLGTQPPPGTGQQAAPLTHDQSFARFNELTVDVRGAADAYRSAADRKEGMIIGVIQAIGAVAAGIALFIPGLNLLAAAALAAAIAATTAVATIITKQAMRGSRYGWEEMVGDVGMAVVDTALAFVGARYLTTARLAGGPLIREAIVRGVITGGIGAMARTAMDDKTWHRGFGHGFGEVVLEGVKGAAVSGITEGIGARFGSFGQGAKRMAQGNGSALRRILGYAGAGIAEGLVGAGSQVAGEAFGMGFDALRGKYQGSFGDAMQQLAFTAVREFVSGGIRSTGNIRLDRRRLDLERRIATQEGPPTPQQLEMLYRYARSTNETDQYRPGEEGGGRVWHGREALVAEVMARHALLQQLPASHRGSFAHLDSITLAGFVRSLQSAEPLSLSQRKAFADAVRDSNPDMDYRRFTQELQQIRSIRRGEDAIRGRIAVELPRHLRGQLANLPIAELAHLPPASLKQLAEMVAQGRLGTPQEMEALVRAAQTAEPTVDGTRLLARMEEAVHIGRRALDQEAATRLDARKAALQHVPPEAQAAFAALPDGGIRLLQRLLDGDGGPSSGQREALLRMVRDAGVEVDPTHFHAALDRTVAAVHGPRSEARRASRQGRHLLLAELPPAVRGPLTALPTAAIPLLRRMLESGQPISPHERAQLLAMARRETPGLNVRQFEGALDRAIEHHRLPPTARPEHREQLASALPASARHLVERVPIHVMDARAFEAATGSLSARAVTILVDGHPQVILKQGAPLHVLAEEGIHIVQAQDPAWIQRIGALDESRLQHWHQLPLEQQVALYHTKLEVEIAAQHQLIEHLRSQAPGAPEKQRLHAQQLGEVEVALGNLRARLAEVESLSPTQLRAMREGASPRPDYLDQAPRLFNKGGAEDPLEVQRRVDRLTGVEREPEHVEAQKQLRQQYEAEQRVIQEQQSAELMQRIERSTGVDKGEEHAESMARLAHQLQEEARLAEQGGLEFQGRIDRNHGISEDSSQQKMRQQMAEHYRRLAEQAANSAVTVTGKRMDQVVDLAAGQRAVDNQQKPWGYGVNYGFDVRFLDNGVAQFTIRLHMDAQPGVTPEMLATVKDNAQRGMDQYYNNPKHMVVAPDGKPARMHVNVEFVSDPAQAHNTIVLYPGSGRANQTEWHVDDHPTVIAHELSHQMGLKDEYHDNTPLAWNGREYLSAGRIAKFAPEVYTDNTLMGNFWVTDAAGNQVPAANTALKRRHVNDIMQRVYQQMGRPVPLRHRTIPRLSMPFRMLRMAFSIAWLRIRSKIRSARGLPQTPAMPPSPDNLPALQPPKRPVLLNRDERTELALRNLEIPAANDTQLASAQAWWARQPGARDFGRVTPVEASFVAHYLEAHPNSMLHPEQLLAYARLGLVLDREGRVVFPKPGTTAATEPESQFISKVRTAGVDAHRSDAELLQLHRAGFNFDTGAIVFNPNSAAAQARLQHLGMDFAEHIRQAGIPTRAKQDDILVRDFKTGTRIAETDGVAPDSNGAHNLAGLTPEQLHFAMEYRRRRPDSNRTADQLRTAFNDGYRISEKGALYLDRSSPGALRGLPADHQDFVRAYLLKFRTTTLDNAAIIARIKDFEVIPSTDGSPPTIRRKESADTDEKIVFDRTALLNASRSLQDSEIAALRAHVRSSEESLPGPLKIGNRTIEPELIRLIWELEWGSWGKYREAVAHLETINGVPAENRVYNEAFFLREMLRMVENTRGTTVSLDNIRGRLKDRFKADIDSALQIRMGASIDIEQSVKRLVELGSRMSSEDKGALFERWFKDVVVQNADAVVYQQQIARDDASGKRIHDFSQDRKPDFVYVENTPDGNGIHNGYVMEMKSHSGALTKRDVDEIGDYLKLTAANANTVTMNDGKKTQIQRVVVMMPDIKGATNSKTQLRQFILDHNQTPPGRFAVLVVVDGVGPVYIDNITDLDKYVPG